MNRWLRTVFIGTAKGGLGLLVMALSGGSTWTQTPLQTAAFSPAALVAQPTEERKVDRAAATGLPRGAPRREDARLLPNLRIFDPTNLHVVGSRASDNLRLKFGTTIWNAGAGPLETRGATNLRTGALEVHQFFHTAGGRVTRGPRIGTFNYNHRHGHLHLEAFARYELWSLDDAGRPFELVALNRKVGFCLMDINPVDISLRNAAQAPVYSGCRADVQGISVGYGDEYVAQLFEQDLDINGLPDGNYSLVTTANPSTTLVEADYADNVASVQLRLRGGTVDVLPLAGSNYPDDAEEVKGSSRSWGLQAALEKGGA